MLNRLSPVALAALGVLLLSAMDAVIKHLAVSHSVVAITFGRFLFGTGAAALIWNGAGRPPITAEMLRAHALRGALIVVVASAFFFSLSVLALAEAVTLAFVAPLLIPLAAWAVVGERPKARSLMAGAVGFVGALIATQGAPDTTQSPLHTLGVIAVFTSAAAYAWAIALLRTRADKDGAPVVGLLQTAIPCVLVAGPAIALSPMPPLADLPWFALMGTLGAGGWYLLINAYGRAEAQRLAPLEFTSLLWATSLGFIFFRESPRPQVYAGAALIIAACVFAEWSERRRAMGPQTPIGD